MFKPTLVFHNMCLSCCVSSPTFPINMITQLYVCFSGIELRLNCIKSYGDFRHPKLTILSGQGLFVFDCRKRYLQNFDFETFPPKLSVWKNGLCWRWRKWSLCSIGIDILWFNMSKARLSFTVLIRRTYCSGKNCSMERWHRINEMFTILNNFKFLCVFIHLHTCSIMTKLHRKIKIYRTILLHS